MLFAKPRTTLEWLIAGYILMIPIGWLPLPWNMQWSDLLFPVLLLSVLASRRVGTEIHLLDILVTAYLVASLVSFSNSTDLARSGIEFSKLLYVAIVYRTFSTLAQEPSLVPRIASWLAASAVVVAGIGLSLLITRVVLGPPVPGISESLLPVVGDIPRLKSTLHSAVYLGSFLTFSLPLLAGIGASLDPARRSVWRLSLAAVGIAAGASLSHPLSGLMVALLFLYWPALSERRYRLPRAAAVIVCLAALLAVNVVLTVSIRDVSITSSTDPTVAAPQTVYEFQDTEIGAQRLSASASYNWMHYFLLKQISWEAFLRHPVAGLGLSEFHSATERAYQEGRISESHRRDDPHSTWLGRLAETGSVGGLTLLLLCLGCARYGGVLLTRAAHAEWSDRAILAGLLGVLVVSLHVDVMNFRFLWVGLGLLRGRVHQL
jgi:hypothetical protein